jgi:hypothetical protein
VPGRAVARQWANQTARRKAIYLELHPETGHGKASPSKEDNLSTLSFSAATADAIGKDERTVRRDAERGEKVSEQALNLVRGTALDTGSYLAMHEATKTEARSAIPKVCLLDVQANIDRPRSGFEKRNVSIVIEG